MSGRLFHEERITRGGLDYRVEIHTDPETGSIRARTLNADEQERWKHGQWIYVGVIVTPYVAGELITDAKASAWEIEFGKAPGAEKSLSSEDLINTYPVPELVEEVRAKLRQIAEELNKALGIQ